MNASELIAQWRCMLIDVGGAWVLFENGTCVTLAEPGSDPAAEASAILRQYGPDGVHSALADWGGTIEVPDGSGWVVASRHADINTFVGRSEVAPDTLDAAIGRLGRSKRERDVNEAKVIHVER